MRPQRSPPEAGVTAWRPRPLGAFLVCTLPLPQPAVGARNFPLGFLETGTLLKTVTPPSARMPPPPRLQSPSKQLSLPSVGWIPPPPPPTHKSPPWAGASLKLASQPPPNGHPLNAMKGIHQPPSPQAPQGSAAHTCPGASPRLAVLSHPHPRSDLSPSPWPCKDPPQVWDLHTPYNIFFYSLPLPYTHKGFGGLPHPTRSPFLSRVATAPPPGLSSSSRVLDSRGMRQCGRGRQRCGLTRPSLCCCSDPWWGRV